MPLGSFVFEITAGSEILGLNAALKGNSSVATNVLKLIFLL
jgi:hypothetical protein